MVRRRKTFTPVEPEGEYSEFACPVEDAPEPEAQPEVTSEPEPTPVAHIEPAPVTHVEPERTKLYPRKTSGNRESNRRLKFTR